MTDKPITLRFQIGLEEEAGEDQKPRRKTLGTKMKPNNKINALTMPMLGF